jgi:hypothetical protein
MDLVGVISNGSTGIFEDVARQRDLCGLSNLIGPVVSKSACVPVFLACHKFDISWSIFPNSLLCSLPMLLLFTKDRELDRHHRENKLLIYNKLEDKGR